MRRYPFLSSSVLAASLVLSSAASGNGLEAAIKGEASKYTQNVRPEASFTVYTVKAPVPQGFESALFRLREYKDGRQELWTVLAGPKGDGTWQQYVFQAANSDENPKAVFYGAGADAASANAAVKNGKRAATTEDLQLYRNVLDPARQSFAPK